LVSYAIEKNYNTGFKKLIFGLIMSNVMSFRRRMKNQRKKSQNQTKQILKTTKPTHNNVIFHKVKEPQTLSNTLKKI